MTGHSAPVLPLRAPQVVDLPLRLLPIAPLLSLTPLPLQVVWDGVVVKQD